MAEKGTRKVIATTRTRYNGERVNIGEPFYLPEGKVKDWVRRGLIDDPDKKKEDVKKAKVDDVSDDSIDEFDADIEVE